MNQSSKIHDLQFKPPGGGFNPPLPPGDPWPTRAETNKEIDRWFDDLAKMPDISISDTAATLKQALNINDYANDANSGIFGDAKSYANLYKAQTIALGILRSGRTDLVKPTEEQLLARMKTTAGFVVQALYRNQVNNYISGLGYMSDFQTGVLDSEIYMFTLRMISPDFINNQLIGLFGDGKYAFVEAVSCLFEQMRPRLNTEIHPIFHWPEGQANDPVMIDVGKKSAVEHWNSVALQHLGPSPKYNVFMALASPVSWSHPVDKWADENGLLNISLDFLGDEFNTFWNTNDWGGILGALLNVQTPTYDRVAGTARTAGYWYRNGTAYGRDIVNCINNKLVPEYPDIFNPGSPRRDDNGYDKQRWVDPNSIQWNPDGTPVQFVRPHLPSRTEFASKGSPTKTASPQVTKRIAFSTENSSNFRSQVFQQTQQRRFDAASLSASFHILDWTEYHKSQGRIQTTLPNVAREMASIQAGHSFPTISVCNGALLADDVLVPRATFSPSQFQWSRQLKEKGPDIWEHGAVHLSGDCTVAHGAISVGPFSQIATTSSPVGAQSVVRVMGLQHAVDHYLLSSEGTFETAYAADHCSYPDGATWADFHHVQHGLDQSQPGAGISITAVLPDLDRNWNDATLPLYSVTATVIPGWILRVSITVTAGLEPDFVALMTPANWKPAAGHPGVPPTFHDIVMDVHLATNVVEGHYTELGGDEEAGWKAGPVHAIYSPVSPKLASLKESTSHQLEKARGNSHAALDRAHAAPSRLVSILANMALEQNDPPVAFLQSMPTPADYDLHGLSQHYMSATGSWWRGDDEKKLFGDVRAENDWLPTELKDGLSGNLQSFLSDHFSKALLVRSLATNDNYKDKFNDDDRDKLTYWWQGKSPHCISRFKEFNDLTAMTARHAFDDSVPDLKPYLDSTLDYGQLFFSTVTNDNLLENLAMTVITGDQNLVNRHCAVLNALDGQNRQFDRQLWDLVQQKQIMTLAQGSPQFSNDFSPFAVDYMRSLMQKIATNDPSIQKDLLDEMKSDINELASILEATSEKDLAFQMFDSASEFGANILSAIDLLGGKPSKNGQGNAQGFFEKMKAAAKNNPKIMRGVAIGKGIIMIVMQGYVLFNAIKFLMDWSDLTSGQRAEAILQVLEATLRACYEIVGVYKAIKGMDTSSLEFRRECVKWNRSSGKRVLTEDDSGVEMTVLNKEKIEDVPRIGPSGEVDPKAPKESLSSQMSDAVSGEKAVEDAVKEFSISEAVISGVMVALNVAVAVTMGMQLKDEWDQTNMNDGIRAMDTINLMVQCAQVVTGVIEVVAVVVGADCAAIPVVGVVVLAAGMVMMLVEAFVSHPKPDPVGDYVKDHARPFIDALDSRPQPQLNYSVTTVFAPDGKSATLQIEITQPENLHPPPEIGQFIIKIFSGDRDADLFLPPTLDKNGRVVPETDITWSVADTTRFTVQGRNNADPNSHSILSRVYPTKPATTTPGTQGKPGIHSPGTSVLDKSKLVIKVQGVLNPKFKSMDGQITEVISNAAPDVMATDVVHKFTVRTL